VTAGSSRRSATTTERLSIRVASFIVGKDPGPLCRRQSPHTLAGGVSAVDENAARVVLLRRATPFTRANGDGRLVIDAAALTAQ
jgi:hypothetical protein